MRKRISFPVAVATLFLSCSEGPGVIQLDDTAWVAGIAYIDRDGDGQLTNTDGLAMGVLTALVLESSGDTLARATTRPDGTFIMARVPAGTYRLVARRGAVGDSVDVLHIDSARITLSARDSVVRLIRLGYPRTTTAAARTLPAGRRITMDGIALNGWSTFGDSVIHFADRTGAMRAVRTLPNSVQAGDSITLVGTTGVSGSYVVLADARANVVVPSRGLPAADSLSTQQTATADAGRVGEAQARVAGAIVRDTGSVGNYRRVGVDDGSGRVEILLHRNIAFPPQSYAPGATVSYTGVLVPSLAGSGWQLRPRAAGDVTAMFPVVSAAQTRTLPIGSRVYVNGIALNGWNTFGDSTVHVADASGAVRAIRVQASVVAAGDSVQVLGTIGLSDGRRALADAAIAIMAAARGLPAIPTVTTAAVASAGGGTLADNQARIANALIVDTATVGADRILGVNDGSGRVEVVLSSKVTFNPGPYVPGGTLTAAGVLVPAPGSSTWRLRPRERNEVTLTFNTVTVSQARAMPTGQQAVLQGLALNSWSVFGDSTVHLLDYTGTLRAVRVVGNVAAGDSIRLVGLMGTRDGQPVLSNASATVMRSGVGLPQPDSISAARARSADQGTRDAGAVRVVGTITGSQSLPSGDNQITISDGSGSVDVIHDSNIAFPPGSYTPGKMLDVTGVLVPSGSGTWRIHPRSAAESKASFPLVTVAEARALPANRTVQIRATALNGWADFGNASIHIRDGTGAIRIINVPQTTVVRGDSVLIHGTVESDQGQPVLRALTFPAPAVLLTGLVAPPPDSVSTLVASTAAGGTRDADQFRVRGLISFVEVLGADVLLTLSDGSGDLVVRLQPASRFPSALYKIGDVIRVSGVLAPTATGTWELKPRQPGEIAIVVVIDDGG
ncbi:hypothetical protein BH23GEM9_BH23GEM9_31780 [soil metagenome]